MSFCKNCGSQIENNAKYCGKCGAQQYPDIDNARTPIKEPQTVVQPVRREVYQGEIRKCPSCGASIPSFTAICPECGHELNEVEQAKSIKLFTTRIQHFDARIATEPGGKGGWSSWGIWKKVGWVILNIYTLAIPYFIYQSNKANNSPASREKESNVQNYVFPNDRESILEALIFVKSQIAQLVSGPINGNTKKWESIWLGKAVQLNQKAMLVLNNDAIAGQTYSDIVLLDKTFKKKCTMKTIRIWAIVIGLFAMGFILDVLILMKIK